MVGGTGTRFSVGLSYFCMSYRRSTGGFCSGLHFLDYIPLYREQTLRTEIVSFYGAKNRHTCSVYVH